MTTADEWKARALKAERRLELRETELECRRLVRWFSGQMLNRFRSNATRGTGWANRTAEELIVKLEENLQDLREALKEGRRSRILHRCADLANVAAMIGDVSDT